MSFVQVFSMWLHAAEPPLRPSELLLQRGESWLQFLTYLRASKWALCDPLLLTFKNNYTLGEAACASTESCHYAAE